MSNEATVKFVSIWDEGTKIRANSKYNPETKEISDVQEMNVDGLEVLEQEYIELPNGARLEVCQNCHRHTLVLVMRSIEVLECPICDA